MILLFRSYWDNDKGSFLPAPSSDSQSATPAAAADKEDKKEKPEKQDKVVNNYFNFWLENDYYFVCFKVNVAKKIAKDMEKWAKTLNQRKESTKVATPAPEYHEPERRRDPENVFVIYFYCYMIEINSVIIFIYIYSD